ncbi:MAG: EAL domain-containing protein [Chromatiaceae bacterium]|nr:EAL domain-containing protein [Chromatiaceae bacterium]MCP5314042.1 EAL domain-containing protein [Chromatiaceae bacterium]
MTEFDDLDSHVVREAASKSLVEHIFFQADKQISHEQGQALARIVIVSLISLFAMLHAAFDPHDGLSTAELTLGPAYALFSIVHYRWISTTPFAPHWRRYMVIVLDLAFTGYVTYAFGLGGLGFYPVFLWIVIGNGLRFGPRYLRLATLVGITSFGIATLLNGVLVAHPGVAIGLMLGLVLMPRLFLAMINRLADANQLLAHKKEEAEYQASHDVLTGLPNRAMLEDILHRAIAQAEREGTHLAVVFIDVDGFKSINDNFGHAAGDLLLKQVAHCLSGSIRGSDTVARLGGDEFIVLLESCGDAATVAAIVGQLFACVGRYYRIGHQETYVTWSCGVAVFPGDGRSASTLIKNADTAMYQAKAAGPNQYRLYDRAMSAEVAKQLELRESLRRGIDHAQFEVHYQPQVPLVDGRLRDVEALVRWRHPERGLLYPGEFIGTAEQTGLIVPIGYQVLEQALADARRWRDRGLGEIRVHVNISPHQLADAGFTDQLGALCGKYDWSPARLGLEITESMLIADMDSVGHVLARLRSQGFIISLDDFGTGFSSLAYLKSLPIDRLKIDRSFVRDIPEDAYDCTLVEATLMIGKQLGLGLIAEGVENNVQMDWLRERGCDQMQGFLFAPGLPVDELERVIGSPNDWPHA